MLNFKQINNLVSTRLIGVNKYIQEQIHSDSIISNNINQHILNSGGKRLRPMLTLLTAECFGYKGNDHIKLAALVEMLHTMTLLHDDVIDEASERRQQPTANRLWGNKFSILAGDFLCARCFEIISQLNDRKIMEILATTLGKIVTAEMLHIENQEALAMSENKYLEIISDKTARLFNTAMLLGLYLCSHDDKQAQAVSDYAQNFGIAFQIFDDIKDITDDCLENKITLPIIYAWHNSAQQQRNHLQNLYKTKNTEQIVELLTQDCSITAAKRLAMQHLKKAQEAITSTFPQNRFTEALLSLTTIIAH